jgi:hypothetical protein
MNKSNDDINLKSKGNKTANKDSILNSGDHNHANKAEEMLKEQNEKEFAEFKTEIAFSGGNINIKSDNSNEDLRNDINLMNKNMRLQQEENNSFKEVIARQQKELGELSIEIKQLISQNRLLREENRQLLEENRLLREENRLLREENRLLREDNRQLHEEINSLRYDVNWLKSEVSLSNKKRTKD